MKDIVSVRVIVIYVSAYLLYVPFIKGQESPSQADLDAISVTIAEVQEQIQNTRQQRNNVELALESSEKAILDIAMDINVINEDIHTHQERLLQLEQQSANLSQQKAEQEKLIAQYILAAFQNGREEYLKLLLNQENIGSSARVLRYYDYFNQARSEKISEFQEKISEIDAISSDILETSRILSEREEALQAQQSELQTQQNERQVLLDELDQALASSENELSRLEIQYQEMALLIEELSRTILELSFGTEGEAFANMRRALPWPLQGPLLNSYGENYALGDLNWEGITIGGDTGTEISAIHHGRVIYADWFSNSGLLLIIDHGDGYMSLYAHNQSLFKEVGEWVVTGESIATVGNTGGRSESGLYFEIRYNGEAQDPLNWLARQ